MYSLYSSPIEFDELSCEQKIIAQKYFEAFKLFYYDKDFSYQDLARKLTNEKIVQVYDHGKRLRLFIKRSLKLKKLPVVVLTHPFVVNGIRIPQFDNINDRNFPYDFSIFLDLYGTKLTYELSKEKSKSYGLKKLYNSIPTWDDMLERIGTSINLQAQSYC